MEEIDEHAESAASDVPLVESAASRAQAIQLQVSTIVILRSFLAPRVLVSNVGQLRGASESTPAVPEAPTESTIMATTTPNADTGV